VNSCSILVGDVRERLAEIPDASVQTCITSPPYWGLRDYGEDGQIGLEQTPDEYVAELVAVFREVRRVLADDGTLWLNLGDSYNNSPAGNKLPSGFQQKSRAGQSGALAQYGNGRSGLLDKSLKPKDLVGIPWRVAFALQADGWWLRQDIIWHKPNPMPESVTDRCTKAHEYLFLLTKSAKYYYDSEAIKEQSKWASDNRAGAGRLTYEGKRQGIEGTGQEAFVTITEKRNKRSVWTITTKPFKGAHFAVMPEALVEPCVLAGSNPKDLVLDPFAGSGTVGVVALNNDRSFVGVELNPAYAEIARERLEAQMGMFGEVVIDQKTRQNKDFLAE
jgi:DNA modification methylase